MRRLSLRPETRGGLVLMRPGPRKVSQRARRARRVKGPGFASGPRGPALRAALDPAARAGPRRSHLPRAGAGAPRQGHSRSRSSRPKEPPWPSPPAATSRSRRFYREHAARLHRGICGKTVGLDDATVEDACAIAWERLLGRPDIDLERYEAYWWLYKVALREAWALGRRQRREQPVGGLNGADEDSLEPVDLDSDVADVVAERIEHASMREVLGRLHWRERRELALFAYGLSYEEIATVTGTSYTAVNRWMARGRNALRAADARRHLSDDDPDGPAR